MNFTNEKSVTEQLHPPFQLDESKVLLLEEKIKKLTRICDELNPYQKISVEMTAELKSVGILELSNPFHITNTLVILLEDAISELHKIKPFVINENL